MAVEFSPLASQNFPMAADVSVMLAADTWHGRDTNPTNTTEHTIDR